METKNRKGFTLLELLVVVLIIGILAGIALPQYQVAVAKAKVASMLPIMRAWKDAYALWKLQYGEYYEGGSDDGYPTADDLGVNWPSDWVCPSDDKTCCYNDEWSCETNTGDNGDIQCHYKEIIYVQMYQGDDVKRSCGLDREPFTNKVICTAANSSTIGEKVCKSMGRLAEGCNDDYVIGG